MAAINSKYHVKIGDFGFLLARMTRTERHYYTRKEAPHFVNKFSSGEPNYRDSTFFPHWVQLNWLNGYDQEFFDDGGKFYRSNGVDTTSQLKLQLENNFTSIGQLVSGTNVTAQENFRVTAQSLYTDANLVCYWNFDGNSTDLKGGRNGTDANITYSESYGRFNQGASFNGTSSTITITKNASLNLSTDWTITFWASPYDTTFLSEVFANGIADGTQGAVFGYNAAQLGITTSTNTYTAGTTLTTGWHMYTYTLSGGTTLTPYKDGVAGTSQTVSGSITAWGSSGSMYFGMLKTNYYYYKGYLDDCAIFSRALTATEISNLYNSSSSLYDFSTMTSSSNEIIGLSDGKIYSWDGALTLTELFDTRRLEWFETGTDANKVVGDTGGTETAQSQGFQLDAACQIKGVQVYLKKAAGTPGDITVRIETDSSSKPSGTLLNASATATIPAFTTSTYDWITVEFPESFAGSATTLYHIVLKTAAAGNDNNYNWAADDSSPGYAAGAMSASTDGGSTWSAVSGSDAYFRVLGNATSVNTIYSSAITGTNKSYIGTGNPTGTVNGDARLYSYDGTTFTLLKIFNTVNESSVNCLFQYGSSQKVYIGLGSKAKVYTTSDFSTFTLAKTIEVPGSPGWVLSMTEYNGKLYVGGGYPQQLAGSSYQYQGFLYSYDEYSWAKVGDFDHTVITALETFDSLLFIGTISKKIYVFNTASIDKLFEFPHSLQVTAIKKWEDKLAFATASTPGSTLSGYEGIYLFDRNGFHLAFSVTNRSWYSITVFKNNLIGGNDDGYIYQTISNQYISTGWLQSSYDEAQLPSIDKLRRSVTLMYESMPSGGTIVVSYKTDESDADWTSLGTASAGTETTVNFAVGTYSKKISFKVTLATTNSGTTPVLKKLIHKYVLVPEFKYMWDMKLLCADNIQWLDGEEPIAILQTATTGGETSITLKSSDDASPLGGFPNPNGSAMYCSIINPTTGVADRFTYTGLTTTTLTGIPATGTNALGAHDAGSVVRITGGDLHQKILDLKQAKTLYTFTDIDGLTYTVLFHAFSEDNFVINQDDYWGGLENEVPITLLEA